MNVLEARRRLLGADVKKKTAEGNPISVRSLARMHPGLSVMGKSTQRTTTGAQLGNLPDLEPTEKKGITWSCNGGVVTVNGTATENSNTLDILYSDVPIVAGEYFSSGTVDHVSVYVEVVKDGVAQYKSGHFTLDGTETSMRFYLMVSKGYTINNVVVYPMLNAGSTALPWEPYTGGQPSPSPDYPQEISSVGDDGSIQVTVGGRNLLGIGTVTFDQYIAIPINIPAGKYMFSAYVESNDPDHETNLILFRKNGQEIAVGDCYRGVRSSSPINLNENADELILYASVDYNSSHGFTATFHDIQLESGTVNTPYEPYKQPQTLTIQTPNGLPGIPVDSGGNYTDADGQQWICDEIDYKRGKYVKRVEKIVIDGEEMKFIPDGAAEFWNLPQHSSEGVTYLSPIMSIYFPRDIFLANNNYDFIFTTPTLMGSYFLSVNDLNEFCTEKSAEGQPLELYYGIEPLETDLTSEQLAQYETLHTNRPTTVASATDGAGLKLSYKTKKSLEVKN